MGTVLGLISLISVIICISISYYNAGTISASLGMVAIVAMVFSLVGLILGCLTVFNKEYYMLFPRLAFYINLFTLLILGGILRLNWV